MRFILIFVVITITLLSFVVYSEMSINQASKLISTNPRITKVIEPTRFIPRNLSLESIFEVNGQELPNLSYSILFTGDVMLGRKVNVNTIKYNDFNWPFAKVASELSNADLTVINLEGPLVYNCPTTTEGFKFCGDSRHITGLLTSGIDVANLANNHSDNYGTEGINETKEILSRVGIQTFNEDEPLTYEIDNQSVVFLGYDVIFQESDPLIPKIQKDITDAVNSSDLLIVSFHWGDEYTYVPNNHQVNLAHAAIDAGADLVIGHHPHWIQTAEVYEEKLILYSLGNFVFDQMWSQETREGLAAKLLFYENILIDVELMPVLIEDYGQPHFLEGNLKSKMIEGIKFRSLNEAYKESKVDY